MATRIKASPDHQFLSESTHPNAILALLACAPMIGFILSPSFQVGRMTGMAWGYAVATGIFFFGGLMISMNRHGGYRRP